ncbi:MAG: hypothetical protein KDC07_06030 [Chitinophagaceae bacterium]|nr:hypothetical protein [Chitinophagaceae bacterium]
MNKFHGLMIIALLMLVYSCNNISIFPIDKPGQALDDDRLIGKWKFEEDTNKNNFYEVYPSIYPHQYHVRFWNRGGTNPTYEANVYYSKVNDEKFLNVPYFTDPLEGHWYLFIRMLNINKEGTKMTGAVVGDESMLNLKSEKQVQDYIAQNIDKRSFYIDTVHFFKIN